MDGQRHDAEVLLRTEHAVARVLTDAEDEAAALPRLLQAIGESLGWRAGAFWRTTDGAPCCLATWPAGAPLGTGDGPQSPLQFPVRGTAGALGTLEFLAAGPGAPDDALRATLTSLGDRIGQCLERWRTEERLRESDAFKSAILEAATDAIITMDADGRVVEANAATETLFGYRPDEMVGRDLADLIIPPSLREPHRRGLERYVRTGHSRMGGHPVELPAMRADGSEFPVEIAITRPALPGPPLFTGFLRDVTQRRADEEALRTAAEELAASRARIVAAGDAERRRLERNLHDGAQQRLVTLSLTLRRAGMRVAAGDPGAQALLAQAQEELAAALEELRELARGIHPSILTDRGLEPALEMLAGRATLPVELCVRLPERPSAPVEAAAYYIVAEALTNAAKHARASQVRVAVDCTDRRVHVEVSDDGVGGADLSAGSGVRGLRDRVEALGGVLELHSPAGGGTTLRARLPAAELQVHHAHLDEGQRS